MAILVAAVDSGSLSAAGRLLGIPLASVSRKVSDLEAHLKTRLLVRSTRKLTPTDAGRLYIVACRRILQDVGDAERAASGEYASAKGDLTITAPIVFGRLHVVPIVVEFLKAYPQIDVRIVLVDRVVNLLEERVDAALRIGELPDSSLVARRVGSIRRVVCASPAYLAARGVPMRPADLRVHDCITFEGIASPQTWRFATRKRDVSVTVHSRLTASTAEAAVDAAVAGMGVACVLLYQANDAIRAGKLAVVLREFEPPPSPASLVFAGQGLLPQKLRAFVDFAVPRLEAELSRIDADRSVKRRHR